MAQDTIDDLLAIMAALRNPESGCPWDIEQDFASIAPYTIEEAYEVADAIRRRDMPALCDELGDLLFQAVYHARLAEEIGAFTFADVVAGICAKMVRRHPHVFGEAEIGSANAQTEAWEAMKARERAGRAGGTRSSALDDVPVALPALARAVKLQKRAARVGFDWDDIRPVLAKIREELAELEAELDASDRNADHIAEEFGDLMFVAANLARHLDIDPEQALANANAKFERRFRAIEDRLHTTGRHARDCTLDELDAEWNAVKASERATSTGG